MVKLRRRFKSTIPNPDCRRIEYVRYADDWVVGVWGTRKFVNSLKLEIQEFLSSLKLELSMEKTLITNARADFAKFLGTHIKRLATDRGSAKFLRTAKGHSKRAATGNTLITAEVIQ